ncbi:MAG TPA: hypothetical protein VH858_10845 [Hyphomicrobiales bacterium]|jgi:hypothetical protein
MGIDQIFKFIIFLFNFLLQYLPALALIFGLASQIVRIIRSAIGINKEIEDKEKQVADIQGSSDADGIKSILTKQLKLATAREELILLQAKSRADLLYRIGALFLIISIACPIAAAWLYWFIDPLTKETITQISELKNISPELPKDLNLAIGRDWHLLLGGITFGFLCLAAARGILGQQAKEMQTYFEVAQKVNYFERLSGVAEINFYYLSLDKRYETDIVNFISSSLLNYSNTQNSKSEDAAENSDDKHTISPITIQHASNILKTISN